MYSSKVVCELDYILSVPSENYYPSSIHIKILMFVGCWNWFNTCTRIIKKHIFKINIYTEDIYVHIYENCDRVTS